MGSGKRCVSPWCCREVVALMLCWWEGVPAPQSSSPAQQRWEDAVLFLVLLRGGSRAALLGERCLPGGSLSLGTNGE